MDAAPTSNTSLKYLGDFHFFFSAISGRKQNRLREFKIVPFRFVSLDDK